MGKFLFKIRRVSEHSFDDLIHDKINASIPMVFDDESECEYNYDVEKLCNKILKSLKKGKLPETKYELLFENYKDYRRDKKGLRKLIKELIVPSETPFKKHLMVSCMSNLNFVKNKHMWKKYTGNHENEGILLVYSRDDIEQTCKNNNIKCGDIKYLGRDSIYLDLTYYWYNFLMCFMTTIDYSKTTGDRDADMFNQMVITGKKLSSLECEYIDDDNLIFIKDKKWKYQNEFRIFVNNQSYDRMLDFFKKGITSYDKYGYTINCKPLAIFLKNGVSEYFKNKIIDFAKLNNIEVYDEHMDHDFYLKYQ